RTRSSSPGRAAIIPSSSKGFVSATCRSAAHIQGAQHQHSKYALRAAAMIRAGVDPGLLDEVVWWASDHFWFWALDALIVYARVAAERMGVPVSHVCEQLAER